MAVALVRLFTCLKYFCGHVHGPVHVGGSKTCFELRGLKQNPQFWMGELGRCSHGHGTQNSALKASRRLFVFSQNHEISV